jgi:hypothetical protein
MARLIDRMPLQLVAVLSGKEIGMQMRVPDENLDDFKSKPELMPDGPAQHAPLKFTGKIEVLKPLARWEGFKNSEAIGGKGSDPAIWYWLSWFHRSLAMGAALSVITFLLGTGLYIAVYGPPSGLIENASDIGVSSDDLAVDAQPADNDLTPTGPPGMSDPLTAADSPFLFNEPGNKHLVVKHRPTAQPVTHISRQHFAIVSNRLQHQPLHPQFWVSQFFPTTLIIFIERGEVKTRIEPQTVTYKKPSVLSN